MVTKSEEDRTMREAVGRRVDDYLVKPASPLQVLSVVTRLLEGERLQQQRSAQDFAARFPVLSRLRNEARGWRDYFALYGELVDWDLRLQEAGEAGLADSVQALLSEVRREFGAYVVREYGGWTRPAKAAEERPPLSTDLVARTLAPLLGGGAVLFVVIDCLRLDQWRTLRPLLAAEFDLAESLYCGILPTATPYARNALFGGLFPDEIAERYPGWWGTDEGSLNAFEDELFRDQLRRLTGREVPVHYEKVFSDAEADDLVGRVRGALRRGRVVSVVFNFVDLLTHGRSESSVLLEVARDAPALRGLTRQWFERSGALRVLREAALQKIPVVLTTDHGSILCERPVTVYARRDATSNLRYKFGQGLRPADPGAVFMVEDERILRFPRGRLATNYVLALEDAFFVYPTKLREYQARYRGSFLHGGATPEEMILPVAVLTPR
jgi:CheY-like chemotaxis protein